MHRLMKPFFLGLEPRWQNFEWTFNANELIKSNTRQVQVSGWSSWIFMEVHYSLFFFIRKGCYKYISAAKFV